MLVRSPSARRAAIVGYNFRQGRPRFAMALFTPVHLADSNNYGSDDYIAISFQPNAQRSPLTTGSKQTPVLMDYAADLVSPTICRLLIG